MVATQNKDNFEHWYQSAIDAVNHHDTEIALGGLLHWDEMIVKAPPSFQSEAVKFKEKLAFTAFPSLSVDEAVSVLEKNLLNFLQSTVDIEEVLHKRFIIVGYGNENADRRVLREAALKNQQMLGGKKVSEWLQAFDKAFPPEGMQEAVAGKFFTQYPGITALNKGDQAILKLLLQVYDEWLRAPLMSIFDTAAVYKKLVELEKSGVKEINMKTFERDYFPSQNVPRTYTAPTAGKSMLVSSQNTVSLPLLQALPKYENLGNQLITRERIKVKSQAEPVRPSLLYWLKCYRDELGIGQHNSVERGNFLFRSENGKKLSGEERERISLVLKSVEENLPLSIDPKSQEIVFPVFQGVVVSSRKDFLPQPALTRLQEGQTGVPSPFESSGPARNDSLMSSRSDSGGLRISRGTSFSVSKEAVSSSAQAKGARPNATLDTGEVSFSTGHVFPAEKEVVAGRDAASKNEATLAFQPSLPTAEQGEPVFIPVSVPQPASATLQRGEPAIPMPAPSSSRSRSLLQKMNMFRIRPVSLGRKDWERNGDHES